MLPKPLTALVVDDEALARSELKFLLSKYSEIKVIGEAENGSDAVKLARTLKPNVVFLDIQMRGISGYEAGRKMLSIPNPPLIVFATAYDNYAVQAFELGAVDYLLKPFDEKRLATTVDRLYNLAKLQDEWSNAVYRVSMLLTNKLQPEKKFQVKKLPLEKNGHISLVDYDDIIFFQASRGSVKVSAHSDKYYYSGTLQELNDKLKEENFMRVHKSYLVNLNYVTELLPWFKGTYWLVMSDANRTRVPVSRQKVKEIKDIFGLI